MAHILLGVTGSIAAFKACHLASDWSKQGHEVRVAVRSPVWLRRLRRAHR